jgi:hypothetical protein
MRCARGELNRRAADVLIRHLHSGRGWLAVVGYLAGVVKLAGAAQRWPS